MIGNASWLQFLLFTIQTDILFKLKPSCTMYPIFSYLQKKQDLPFAVETESMTG